MNTARAGVLTLTACLAMTCYVHDVAAQTRSKQREVVMEKCIARAHREYPDPGESQTFSAGRVATYKACMAENGQNP